MDRTVSTYFTDGKKSIDFILVYRKSLLAEDPDRLRKFHKFTDNLGILGLNLESSPFVVDSDVVFMKIHAPDNIVFLYSGLCDVTLACRDLAYRPVTKPPPYFMATPLSHVDVNSDIYHRAPELISSAIPQKITSAERIIVVYKLMVRVRYGSNKNEYGINKMCGEKAIIDYFPVNEGVYHWTESGPLSDRQILAKYWGDYRMCYKAQPIHLIEQYYGPEVGFFFAWVGFYTKMLAIPALTSIIVLIYGMATLNTDQNIMSKEICESDALMCPKCHYSMCKFESLNSTCGTSNFTYVFSNLASIINAIFIALWSTVFLELWKRNESVLRFQWNVKAAEYDTITRPEYLEQAHNMKYSPVTDDLEPYIPAFDQFVWHTIPTVLTLFLLFLILFGVTVVMTFRIYLDIMVMKQEEGIIARNGPFIVSFMGACFSAFSLFLFNVLYQKVAIWLTYLEHHRTQSDFDSAYCFKQFGFVFVNYYSAVVYIAFFKGRFFTHPGDLKKYQELGILGSDLCPPGGCTFDLIILLTLVLTVKSVFVTMGHILDPMVQNRLSIIMQHVTTDTRLAFYEREFLLPATDRYFLVDYYLEYLIQYGYIVCFASALPVAPLFALVYNAFHLRTASQKMTKRVRRPIPQKVTGLGGWYYLIKTLTYVGVVFNAFVIAFTSTAVDFEVYRFRLIPAENFLSTIISAFDIKEFAIFDRSQLNQTWCYYPGRRYPPDHPKKYELTTDFWYILGLRFLVVVIFEHLVMIVKGICAYSIAEIPKSIARQLAEEERRQKLKSRTSLMRALS